MRTKKALPLFATLFTAAIMSISTMGSLPVNAEETHNWVRTRYTGYSIGGCYNGNFNMYELTCSDCGKIAETEGFVLTSECKGHIFTGENGRCIMCERTQEEIDHLDYDPSATSIYIDATNTKDLSLSPEKVDDQGEHTWVKFQNINNGDGKEEQTYYCWTCGYEKTKSEYIPDSDWSDDHLFVQETGKYRYKMDTVTREAGQCLYCGKTKAEIEGKGSDAKTATTEATSATTPTTPAATTPATVTQPTVNKIANKKGKKLYVSWQAVNGASGYQVQYSKYKSFKKATTKTISAQKTSYTKKLSKGKTYYVRMRSYQVVNGQKVYSGWTAKKKIKIKK